MRRYIPVAVLTLLIVPSTIGALAQGVASPVGVFEGRTDVGKVLHPGTVVFDAAKKSYALTASGHNMWATEDGFHYVWKRVSGDVSIAADITWNNFAGNPHKKAVLVMRQSLDADAAYADAAAHGDGTFSLQAREEAGAPTHEVQANAPRPVRLRLEKVGDYFYMSSATEGQPLKGTGGAVRVPLKEPFYIGIGLCAHDPNAIEAATFSNVTIEPSASRPTSNKSRVVSTIETITVSSTDRRAIQVIEGRAESPVWTMDNTFIYANGGRLFRIPVAGGEPSGVDAAMPGREPGPERSPDAAYVYYTAESAGRMQVWRKRADGSEPEALTSDEYSNWFPHPSPDGLRLVFLSYPKGTRAPKAGEADYGDVVLRVMTLADRKITTLVKIVGGRGTIDLPSWSPDSRRLAFVSYQLVP